MKHLHLLSSCAPGDRGEICVFNDVFVAGKMIDLGCLVGIQFEVLPPAPMGDPMSILVEGGIVSVRKEEAATIQIEKLA